MKVLIVKTSALGDVVHALPVLAYLKSARPDVRIDWLVEEAFAPLIADHPLLNRVIVLRSCCPSNDTLRPSDSSK